LCANLDEVLGKAEVVVIGTRGLDKEALQRNLRKDHIVVDLVNLEKARRVDSASAYAGICW